MFAKISILIPLYNSEKYISETLKSCLNQTYKNIEIIIVDDHSTDNSYHIAIDFQQKYPEIISVYSNPKKGACAARNYAFERSKGDYIQYLDADDLLAPDKIEKQIIQFSLKGNNIVVNGRWGRFYNSIKDVKWESQYINKDYSKPVEWLIDSWHGKGMMAQHAWLIPRNIITKAGPWNEELLLNQDGEFFSRVTLNSSKIIYVSDSKVYYRSGLENSVSKALTKEKVASLLYSYQLYVKYMQQYTKIENICHALMMNFSRFIYQYYGLYPDLVKEAKEEIKKLGYNKPKITGGNTFKMIAWIIGFENTLRIRSFILQFKH